MESSCTTAGNGDLYGLGVRIGLYLQCAAGFLLRNFNGSWKTISAVRVANNAICYSIILTMVIENAQGSALSTDYLLVYYLTIALFYSESYNLLEKKEAPEKHDRYILQPDIPLILQNFLCALASFFGGWFWIRGLSRVQSPHCTPKAACFGVFDLDGHSWRGFAATMSIMAGLIFTIFFIVHLVTIVSGKDKGPVVKAVTRLGVRLAAVFLMASGARRTRHYPYTYRLRAPSKTNFFRPVLPRTLGRFPNLMSLAHWTMINLLGPLLAIISVERMLRANHIDTEGILSSSGQMMALLTGIGSLCMALTELMKDIWAKDQPDVVEDLLTAYAYCSSSPLSDVRTKSAVQQFIDLECQRDPAFLEELIQLPKEGHSTLMTDSVRASNRDIANLALSTSDPDTPTSPKATTLKFMATAREGRISDIQCLLEEGTDPNCRDEDGRTPLLWASIIGNTALVELLLGADRIELNCEDDFGRTPLWWAVANGHCHIVQVLLDKQSIDVNCRDLRWQRTPLACAAWSGDESLVRLLLANEDVDPDCYNAYGRTPLSEAAGNGHTNATQLLLKNKRVDPNRPDRDERTPLGWAAMNGHEAVVRILLSLDDEIDVYTEDQFHQTALSLAAKGGHEGVVRLLLEHGIHPNPRDRYSRPPLCWAAMHGHTAVVKLLFEMGADPQLADRYGRTPLCWAAIRGHSSVVEFLLSKVKRRLHVRDICNRVPLSWAARNGHESVVDLLDIDGHDKFKDCDGQTALSIAIHNGDVNISSRLLGPYKHQRKF